MSILTIAIPTYNRGEILRRQLEWLAAAVAGHEHECEVFISDNASTDSTPEVVAEWCAARPASLQVTNSRNPRNLGVMANIAACYRSARTPFVWVVGDDDDIGQDTFEWVFDQLRDDSTPRTLCLNYSMVDIKTGALVKSRRFELSEDYRKPAGKALIQADDAGVPLLLGLGFMTSQIFPTAVIRSAVESWADFDNLEIQIYWSGACMAEAPAVFTKDVMIQYNCGDNILSRPEKWYQCRYLDAPQVYEHLAPLGYGKRFSRRLALSPAYHPAELREFLGGLFRWPGLGMRCTVGFLSVFFVLLATGGRVEEPRWEAGTSEFASDGGSKPGRSSSRV